MIGRCLACVAVLVTVLVPAAPAAADPAGPTEYLTTIEAIEPPTEALSVRMIGGDSFFELTQLEPVLIEVVGYEAEPYLRIRPDGTVEENRLSPTTYLNQERYGTREIVPEFTSSQGEPDWVKVADGGRYAWHDHRSHWMNSQRPPGAQPGDTILEAAVPLRVDGQEVLVTVTSVLQEPPSPLPAILGGVAGIAVVAGVLRNSLLLLAAPVAAAALVAGMVEYFSVPPETGPPLTLWLPSLLGVLGVLLALVVMRVRGPNPLLAPGLVLVAGVQLCVWAFLSRSSLSKPILPTDLSWPLHRFVIAVAFVSGLGLIGYGLDRLFGVVSRADPQGLI
ncbi:MAG: hypothetical protein HKN24_08050 [Acidimicrobiales bacterium]|nr:hypothetical protein [Acidimicrobiales bacterium]